MKQISELKQGDKFYDVLFKQVKSYRYLCIHPTGRSKYHILIDAAEEYILMNKPSQITLTDIKQWWLGSIYSDEILESMMKLVKSKL